jgi:lipoprotein-releasing system permease protein
MYKLLLCWRYLRTRYIAIVSIVSVTLGVATLIVTNSVMEGFSEELGERSKGFLSDITFEARSMDGVADADWHMREIRSVAGEYIEGMSPTVVVPAMLSFTMLNGEDHRQQITLIGIDDQTYASVSDFGHCLQHPANRKQLNFDLKDGGYDTIDTQSEDPARAAQRPEMINGGWTWRRMVYRPRPGAEKPMPLPTTTENPFGAAQEGEDFDPTKEQQIGCVLGLSLGSYRTSDSVDHFIFLPGHDVDITYVSAGKPPKPHSAKFTVVDFFESKMSDADSTLVFVPIAELQKLRGMIDPVTQVRNFNSIQIRLKPGTDVEKVCAMLRGHQAFPMHRYSIGTWRDKQATLLSAIQLEIILLNILLFMIIAVAGFGILAIFMMIVVEKTRDIGILKSLGASGSGIMGIFVSYGLSLGLVGAGAGTAMGLTFVYYINEIADGVSWLMGHPVFDRSVYLFEKIPTTIDAVAISAVVIGAVVIAVLASVIPACRAAGLHPVEALRYE